MKKPPKASSLIDYIAAHIATGYYPAGSRIPSLRRLAAKFGVSYGTAFGGIGYLEHAGLISREPGKGYLVAGNRGRPETMARIAVFAGPNAAVNQFSMCYQTLMRLQELACRDNCALTIVPVPRPEITPALVREVIATGVQGIIFLNEYDAFLPDWDFDLPAAGTLFGNTLGGKVTVIEIDPFDAAEKAAAYLRGRSVRRAIICSAKAPVYRRRGEVFETVWRRTGGSCRWDTEWESKLTPEDGEGVFFTSDHFAESHLRTMASEGYDLASRPICSVDGKRLLSTDFHRFPTVAIDWRLVGGVAFDEISRLIKSPDHPVRRISLAGQLIIP